MIQDYGLKIRLAEKLNVPLCSLSTLNVLQIDTFFLRFYFYCNPFSIKIECIFLRPIKSIQLISFDVLIKMISIYICPSKHFCQRTQVYYENVFFTEQGFAKLTFPCYSFNIIIRYSILSNISSFLSAFDEIL